MGKYKILVGDQTLVFGKRCANELDQNRYQILLTENNGLTLFQKIREEKPDLVIMDCYAPHMDIWAVIANAEQYLDYHGRYIVYGRWENALLKEELERYGQVRYLAQPFTMSYLYQAIEETLRDAIPMTPAFYHMDLEQQLGDWFTRLYVPVKMKGYRYLMEGIIIGIKSPDKLDMLTKGLYPQLANLHGTTITSVERAMRIAIDAAWNSPGRLEFDRLFGVLEKRPSNQMFLKVLVKQLQKEEVGKSQKRII